MIRKSYSYFFLISIIFFLIFYLKFYSNNQKSDNELNTAEIEENYTKSNNILDVVYKSTDAAGNEYTVVAKKGEVDIENANVIFLTDVSAIIQLNNNNKIVINSNYGKYNSINFDTIFSRNVTIEYLDNYIKAGYLEFSLVNNIMIISKNVIYNNRENILLADVMEMKIDTKDSKIFMYDINKKVNVKSIN